MLELLEETRVPHADEHLQQVETAGTYGVTPVLICRDFMYETCYLELFTIHFQESRLIWRKVRVQLLIDTTVNNSLLYFSYGTKE